MNRRSFEVAVSCRLVHVKRNVAIETRRMGLTGRGKLQSKSLERASEYGGKTV